METKFNFKSAICTSRSQSERLLALGLKNETADMVLCEPFDYEKRKYSDGYAKIVLEEGEDFCKEDIPAWSLHRLIEMCPDYIQETYFGVSAMDVSYYFSLCEGSIGYKFIREGENLYDNLIDCIEWLIKEEEYLV